MERVKLLKMLSSQAAISLENAKLYASLETVNQQLEENSQNLEVKVTEKTLELQEKNDRFHQTIQSLKRTQNQLIQTEKMSSLGQLVAGITHEINHPANFINAKLEYAEEYAKNLLETIELYQQNYPNPTQEIVEEINQIELDFLKEDLPSLLESMKVGSNRISQIVLSLKDFSSCDELELKYIDITWEIETSLMRVGHQLKKTEKHPEIRVTKDYGILPKVECYSRQFNQVVMNILTNAIDALEMAVWTGNNWPEISISTKEIQGRVQICIADNGLGMTPEVQSKMFDPFFTTKPVGSGTGLGLAVSYQMIVEKHGGKLWCDSALGDGAKFTMEIPIRQQTIR